MTDEYAPNTLLNIDIRKYTSHPLKILAMFRKAISDTTYTECVYKAKKSSMTEAELLSIVNSYQEL